MTEREILSNVIDKAIANGLSYTKTGKEAFYQHLIFSHSFAKAFWGEKLTCLNLYAKEPPFADEMVHLPAFAYHLQKMVLEENPIKYLERFL